MSLCLHCGERPVCRPRGLCLPCYYTPGVREQYASGATWTPDKYGALPCEPTTALPGTEEKLAVLEARAAAGQELFHRLDPALPMPVGRYTIPKVREPLRLRWRPRETSPMSDETVGRIADHAQE